MTTADRKILVIGATGMLGAPVVHHLIEAGWKVRVLARDTASAEKRFHNSVEIVRGDVTDSASVSSALTGCSAVHVSLQGRTLEDFEQVEHQGTARVAQLAAKQGIERLTYLSGALVSAQTTYVPQEGAKWAAEEAIVKSGVPYTIFKPTFFMESLPLNVRGKRASVMGAATKKFRFVAADDYAALVVKALQTPAAANQRLDVYGPQAMTLREATEIYVRSVDPSIKVSMTPFWMMKAMNRLFMKGSLTHVIELMELTETVGETGSPALTSQILGTPSTTLAQWCARSS